MKLDGIEWFRTYPKESYYLVEDSFFDFLAAEDPGSSLAVDDFFIFEEDEECPEFEYWTEWQRRQMVCFGWKWMDKIDERIFEGPFKQFKVLTGLDLSLTNAAFNPQRSPKFNKHYWR